MLQVDSKSEWNEISVRSESLDSPKLTLRHTVAKSYIRLPLLYMLGRKTQRGEWHLLIIHMHPTPKKEALEDTCLILLSVTSHMIHRYAWYNKAERMPPVGRSALPTIINMVKIPAQSGTIKEERLSQSEEGMWLGLIWRLQRSPGFGSRFAWLYERTRLAVRDSYDAADAPYHNMCCKHNAICSTPTPARCRFTLERGWAVGTDFRFVIIILWPGIQFILQYCWWAWAEIDLNWRKSWSSGK